MAWEMDLAQAIKNTGRKAMRHRPQAWCRAEVVQVMPTLVFAIADQELQFDSGTGLIMTATARSRTWKLGTQAAALLQGAELLVLDAL